MRVEINGKRFMVRSLTRGELKELRAKGAGLDESIKNIKTISDVERALEPVFALGVLEGDPDDLTYEEAFDLWGAIAEVTYAGEDAKKKPGSRRPSSLKAGSRTAGSAKKQGSRPRGTARKSQKKAG